MKRQAVTGASTGADRRNRFGLILLGLVLLAIGVYGLARGWGAFGQQAASEPVLVESWRRAFARNSNLWWPAVGLGALLVSLLGMRWLRAQVAPATFARIDLAHREEGGMTVVRPAGAARALADDIETYRGVAGASARVIGDPTAPEIDLRVEVVEGCDVPTLRSRIEEEALVRFQEALELESLDAKVEFRLTAPSAS